MVTQLRALSSAASGGPTSLLLNCHRVENSKHRLTRSNEVGWEE
jgi:hypothetical protein